MPNNMNIKDFIHSEGTTMKELLSKLSADYGWSSSESNFSRKLSESTIRLCEVIDITDALGFDIEFVRREDEEINE